MSYLARTLLAATIGAGAFATVGTTAAPASTVVDTRCTAGETKLVNNPQSRAGLDQLGFPSSWRSATGKGQVVAVVDSGVDARNQHFDEAVVGGRSFVGGNATDDATGHGTAIAGIIAARKIKGSVLEGAAPGARIVPVRVIHEEAETSTVAEGIRWAAELKVDVINISISTGPSDGDLPELRSAVRAAVRSGAVVVAAAGNQLEDKPYTQVQYPAGLPGVVGVAATNPAGDVDNWSTHGSHVDVAAPGTNVLTAFRANGDCLVGLDRPYSSYAAAYVSGLAAQLREKFPADTPAEIINRLTSTADRPSRTNRDDAQGWGQIQPLAALGSSSNAAPSEAASTSTRSTNRGITPMSNDDDPSDPARTTLLWWAMAMSALMAVALIARPMAERLRRDR